MALSSYYYCFRKDSIKGNRRNEIYFIKINDTIKVYEASNLLISKFLFSFLVTSW